jgi:hypothetical protein
VQRPPAQSVIEVFLVDVAAVTGAVALPTGLLSKAERERAGASGLTAIATT